MIITHVYSVIRNADGMTVATFPTFAEAVEYRANLDFGQLFIVRAKRP